ncbi:MAG TPA: OsmC family protein [Actinomycetota bacterium]|nr:OsmC family protein [Actinomycetota bacterium]
MSEQRLRWDGDLRFEGRDSGGHRIAIGGEPDGAGAKASDLLPLSLAACAVHDVVVILRKQRQDLRGLEVRIDSHQGQHPPWPFEAIRLRMIVSGDVDPVKARRALDLSMSKYCAVFATLSPTVRIETEVEVPDHTG